MELNHTRNEEKKTTDYIVTVTDSELEEFKEKTGWIKIYFLYHGC